MLDTQYSRRLDSLGRLVIPKKLRDTYGIEAEVEYKFYLHDYKDKKYLCIELPDVKEQEIAHALAVLRSAGIDLGGSDIKS